MAIASFQKKTFTVSSQKVYTFSGLTWSGALDTESQEKLKDKPSTYIKGHNLDTMSIEIQLRSDFKINVRAEIEEWEAIRTRAAADFFILGTKPLGKNRWLLRSVATSDTEIDNKGRLIKAKLKLDFEEYIRPGSAAASAAAKKTKKSATSAVSLDIAPTNYITSPVNKADDKRTNPNVSAATKTKINGYMMM